MGAHYFEAAILGQCPRIVSYANHLANLDHPPMTHTVLCCSEAEPVPTRAVFPFGTFLDSEAPLSSLNQAL